MTAPYEAAHFKLYKAMLPLDHTTFFLYKTQCLRMVPRSRWRSSRQDREGVGDYEQKEQKQVIGHDGSTAETQSCDFTGGSKGP